METPDHVLGQIGNGLGPLGYVDRAVQLGKSLLDQNLHFVQGLPHGVDVPLYRNGLTSNAVQVSLQFIIFDFEFIADNVGESDMPPEELYHYEKPHTAKRYDSCCSVP